MPRSHLSRCGDGNRSRGPYADVAFFLLLGRVPPHGAWLRLGMAHSQGWRIGGCAFGDRAGMKSVREWLNAYEREPPYRAVDERSRFQLSMLATRLCCPRCGSRKVAVFFRAAHKHHAATCRIRLVLRRLPVSFSTNPGFLRYPLLRSGSLAAYDKSR